MLNTTSVHSDNIYGQHNHLNLPPPMSLLYQHPASTLSAHQESSVITQSAITSVAPLPPLHTSIDTSANLFPPDSEGSDSEDDDTGIVSSRGKTTRREWTSKDIEKLVNAVHAVEPYSYKVGIKSKEAWEEVLDIAQRLGGCQNRSAAALRKKMTMIIKAAKNGNSRLWKQLEKDGLFIRLSSKIDKIDDAIQHLKTTDEANREANKQAQDEKKAEGELMRSAMLASLASRSSSKRIRDNTPTDESDKENTDPKSTNTNSSSIESPSTSSRSQFKKRRQGDHVKQLSSVIEHAMERQEQQHQVTLEEARLAREQTNLVLEEARSARQQQTETTRQFLEEMRKGCETQENIGLQMVEIFQHAFRDT